MFGQINELPQKKTGLKLDTPYCKANPDVLQEWKIREEANQARIETKERSHDE